LEEAVDLSYDRLLMMMTEINTADPPVCEPSACGLRWLLKRLNGTNRQLLIRFQQN
jgi:hypothetical protein